MQTFSRSAYVGYTATPFANIFIPHDVQTIEQGEDLFPRSFIINLPVPSNYIGPARVFGLAAESAEINAGLPIVRYVTDSETQLPGSHQKTLSPTALPDSLKEAIKAFILTCATRLARGQSKSHNTMLIHVTRFVDVQAKIKDFVEQELHSLRRRIEYGDGSSTLTLRDELRILWQKDYVPTTKAVQEQLPEDHALTTLTWPEVEVQLIKAVAQTEVKQINGTAKDVLDYYDHKDGLSVIAIGGDKLSRGLTLEGLSISYYLRASRMYDTLMQMGRWFGYRPGYADLCRLYTTKELEDWYKHITIASEELREDFDVMAAQGLTPREYGLKVQTHPGGLTVTSSGKIRYGTKIKVAFSGQLVETYRLSKSKANIEHNFDATDKLVQHLEQNFTRSAPQEYVWKEVSDETVTEYLSTLWGNNDMPPTTASNPAKLAEFIKIKSRKGELVNWTIALISSRTADHSKLVGGLLVGLPLRTPENTASEPVYILKNRHILTESNEWIDLSEEEKTTAVNKRNEREKQKNDKTPKTFKEPNGTSVRAVRPKTRSLLLIYPLDPKATDLFPDGDDRAKGKPVIGYAISFPGTNSHEDMEDAVEYIVNRVYVQEEFEAYKQEEEMNNNAD